MNLIRLALPLASAFAAVGLAPAAAPPAVSIAPPSAQSSKPAARPSVRPTTPVAPPVLVFHPAPSVPGRARTFIVPAPHGGQTVITIPRCYLVPNMQSLAASMQAASRAQYSPLFAMPGAPPSAPFPKFVPLPVIPPFTSRALPAPPLLPPLAPAGSGDTQYQGARIILRAMPQIPASRLAFDFRSAPVRFSAAGEAKRQMDKLKQRQQHLDDLFKQRQALPNAAMPPAPR